MLASHFQGFCRDLHSEAADALAQAASPAAVSLILRTQLVDNRQLDRGNAQPSSLGSDFGRFDLPLWDELRAHDARSERRSAQLMLLSRWRNAIAHQEFSKTGGKRSLNLASVRRFRSSCNGLANSMDAVLRAHLNRLTGANPW